MARSDTRPPAPVHPWLFRFLAVTLLPVGLVVLLELALRWAGAGYDPRYFIPNGGSENLTINERFFWRFFPPAVVGPAKLVAFPARKAAGTCRIFVLGSSAAMGTPEPAFSFSRFLEVMLRERFPGTRFEVINTAVAAINSHVIREIARECVELDPDLLVVYLGHNEVVGPFGPGSVFGRFSPRLWSIRATVRLGATRIGQLITRAARAFSRQGALAEWQGMATFMEKRVAPGDPALASVRDHLRRNLDDIIRRAVRRRVPVVLCTLATNVRDCAPFASVHRADLAPDALRAWEALYREGAELEGEGLPARALEKYTAAAERDDRYAELRFCMGRCLWALGERDAARAHFLAARDLDALRFRADSGLNQAIRDAAAAWAEQGVRLVDAERRFEQSPLTPDRAPGAELLLEHVHPTVDGTYELAAAVCQAVAEELPERIRADRAAAFAPPSKNRCAEALALTGWDRYRMAIALSTLTGRPPFVNQVDYASQRRRLAQEIAILRRETTPDGIQRALQAYLDALESQPRDLYLLRNMGLLQQARGDFAAAATCWRRILMQIPRHAETRVSLGACLLATGAADEARRQFNEGLKATSNPVEIRRQTGLAFARAGRWADATAEYRSALALEPGHVQLRLMLAEALMHQGKAADGLREMEDAARARPTDPEIKFRLGALRLEQGRLDEAVDLLSEAVGLDPAIEPARDLLERAVRMRQNGHAN